MSDNKMLYLLALGILLSSPHLAAATQTRQLVIVAAPNWDSRNGKLEMLENVSGGWLRHDKEIPVVLGEGLAWGRGLQRSSNFGPRKREGDKRSPAGIFSLGPLFGYAETPPAGCRFPYRAITARDFFVDDPTSKEYNQWVRLPLGKNRKVEWRSAEKMLRADRLYELGIVIHHNMSPTTKGAGSAIFFHVWRNASTPTIGCTAMAKRDLLHLIQWLDPGKKPLLIQAPASEIESLRRQIGIAR